MIPSISSLSRVPLRALIAATTLSMALAPTTWALTLAEAVPASEITGTPSSAWPNMTLAPVINGAGLNEKGLHVADPECAASWHTANGAKPASPADGLPEFPAFARFDFASARELGKCQIWNHNQPNLVDRGFRHTRLYVSSDGKTFKPVKVDGQDTFEIPRASGKDGQAMSCEVNLPKEPVKAVILAAVDNHGSHYYGLSEVRFLSPAREVADADLPAPKDAKVSNFPFSPRADGSWERQVEINFGSPVYGPIEATATVDGVKKTTTLPATATGSAKIIVPLPDGKAARRSATDAVDISLKGTSWTRELKTAVQPPANFPNLEEVVVVWKCHLDIGYTHPVPEVIEKYRGKDMDALLAMFEKTKDAPVADRFRWMLPGWAMNLVLDEHQDPARRAKLEQAVKDKRLMWHAIPYTFESDGADLEELVRGFSYGNKLSRRFGMPLVTDSKQTDMPEQAWAMPTVLANAGVNFLHIGANDGSKPLAEFAKIPPLCLWEGPDGSRILLGYSAYYGWASIRPPANWKHKTWLAFFVRGDNQGPPSPQEVEATLAQGRKALPGVNIHFGRPSDFADAILREEKEKPQLPVIRADMPDTWCHGQMSMPVATAIHRRAAPALGTLGQLDTTLRAEGVSSSSATASLDDGYQNGGFYAEHTWGWNGTYYRGSFGEAWKKRMAANDPKYKDAIDSFEYHMNYARKAMATADAGIAPRMQALAQAVAVDGPRITVFNPLPWKRDALVSATLPAGFAAIGSVIDTATHKPAAFHLKDDSLWIDAHELPPGGHKTFALKPGTTAPAPAAKPLPADRTVRAAHFTAVFDLDKGGIASLKDTTGKELVMADDHVLGQFLHERFSTNEVNRFLRAYARPEAGGWVFGDFGKAGMPGPDVSPYAALTPKNWTATVTESAIATEVRLKAGDTLGLAKGVELTFTFPKAKACVDIAWSVDSKTPDPIPEGGWLCLPFKVENPSFRLGRVGGTIDPAKDIAFGGSRNLITLDRGATVRSGPTGAGMLAVSEDLPLWSPGKPGLWTYEPDYVPSRPELFVNLYNNMWNTNYPLWVDGSWKASVRVMPVAANASEEQALFTPSWELRQPAVAGFATGAAGKLPASQAGVTLSRKGTRVTAFCENPDGKGTLLRVWEQAGENGALTISLPPGTKATKATPVNLRGVPSGAALPVTNGRIATELKPWAPASFVLE